MNWGDMGLLALKNALRSRQKTFFCALAVCVDVYKRQVQRDIDEARNTSFNHH